jgi:hypothetical protein
MTTINSIPNALIYATDPSGVLNIQTNSTTALSIASNSQVAIANTMYVANSTTFATNVSMPNTFGFKNRIINGAMVIDQRNAGASLTPTTNGQYTVDRWQAGLSNASKYSVQQSSTAPDGFKTSLLVTSLAATSVAAGDYYSLLQPIEGFNTYDLMFGSATAKTITISFWVRSSLTGLFGGWIENANVDRSYPFSYTINSANTWQQIVVTIPGDITGTWVGATNGVGIYVGFSLGMGSTRQNTANAWASGNYRSVTGETPVVGTNGATFYITGVQLEVGTQATSFDYRPYTNELALCQRYLPAGPYNGATYVGQATSTTTNLFTIPFQVTTRVAPTGVVVNSPTSWGTTNSAAAGIAASTVTFNGASLAAGSLIVTIPSASLVAGNASLAYAGSSIAYFTGCEL